MPNVKNAKKAVKRNLKRKINNNDFKASMKTAMRNVEKAVISKDKQKADDCLKIAITRLDKACKKGVVTPNFVARNKSRLTKKVNVME